MKYISYYTKKSITSFLFNFSRYYTQIAVGMDDWKTIVAGGAKIIVSAMKKTFFRQFLNSFYSK